MLRIDNFNYASPATIVFQRCSVIVADLMFAYGTREIGRVLCKTKNSYLLFTFLSLFNVGLLVVDHVHFQYNGFLLGILLLSMAKVSEVIYQGEVLVGATWFAILLNLKHIYLYTAPAYTVWLLKWCCTKRNQFLGKFIKLGFIVVIVFFFSFGPFIDQLPQVLSRLFPFKRGLVHAYWAPNFWALYAGADKILSAICRRAGWLSNMKIAIMTGGLVQEDSFALLPTPTPLVTFAITFLTMLHPLWVLFTKDRVKNEPSHFVRCAILCSLSSFLFGWHVHEKAILTAIIPLCCLAVTEKTEAKVFMILSSAGHTALLPLLYPENLTPLKLLLSMTYMTVAFLTLSHQFGKPLLNKKQQLYITVLPLITVYETIIHKLIFRENLPFLPLALTSIYCAAGIMYTWIYYYYIFLYKIASVSETTIKTGRSRTLSDSKSNKIK
ncbi:probable dolichyl pyrophosphate Glc1Man9GlcNAc2 alpha-1,3-glucosyltransferase isoform X2 [Orussus abietinus]|nr:probable dolichyl pyrophosphate Glc1Man9GlcNAc2 alpha-1,3-glucosyltransferase isoform X2 [Orussus abietinus]